MERIKGCDLAVFDVGCSCDDRIHVTAHVKQGSHIRDDSLRISTFTVRDHEEFYECEQRATSLLVLFARR